MTDFAPGDVVVCVDVSIMECPHAIHTGENAPPVGSLARVRKISREPDCPACTCRVIHTDEGVGIADRFRKLKAADDQFTEQMRALRPEKVTATLSGSSENRNG